MYFKAIDQSLPCPIVPASQKMEAMSLLARLGSAGAPRDQGCRSVSSVGSPGFSRQGVRIERTPGNYAFRLNSLRHESDNQLSGSNFFALSQKGCLLSPVEASQVLA